MAKAKKSGASQTDATKKKATRVKKPAAAKKAAKKATTVRRKPATATRSAASKAKPAARASAPGRSAAKARSGAGASRKVAAKAPKTRSAKAAPARAKSRPAKSAAKANRRVARPQTLVVPSEAIDTSLAAEVAANMVLNHMSAAPAGDIERAVNDAFSQAAAAPKRETSTFRHLKETVSNPTAHQLDGLFGVLATKKRPNLPFARTPVAGPSQTLDKDFGLEVKRQNGLRRKAG